MRIILLAILVSVFARSSMAADAPPSIDRPFTAKVEAIPHFYQLDPRADLPNGGREYCCPVAVSDAFVYFAKHGYSRLLGDARGEPFDLQVNLIRSLASREMMQTNPEKGTDPGEAMHGIRRFVEARGYACDSLQYAGWRPIGSEAANRAALAPDLQAIKQTVADPAGAAWLNIGWYVGKDAEWKRAGGHWVCVSGFGIDAAGHEDPSILLIDDPNVRAMTTPTKADKHPNPLSGRVLHVQSVTSGRLVGDYKGLPVSAAGYYKVSGPALHISRQFDAAFVDGAILLTLRPPK